MSGSRVGGGTSPAADRRGSVSVPRGAPEPPHSLQHRARAARSFTGSAAADSFGASRGRSNRSNGDAGGPARPGETVEGERPRWVNGDRVVGHDSQGRRPSAKRREGRHRPGREFAKSLGEAERAGFEPAVTFLPHGISSAAPSAARSPLRLSAVSGSPPLGPPCHRPTRRRPRAGEPRTHRRPKKIVHGRGSERSRHRGRPPSRRRRAQAAAVCLLTYRARPPPCRERAGRIFPTQHIRFELRPPRPAATVSPRRGRGFGEALRVAQGRRPWQGRATLASTGASGISVAAGRAAPSGGRRPAASRWGVHPPAGRVSSEN